jgi:hypothetical protein
VQTEGARVSMTERALRCYLESFAAVVEVPSR